MPQGLMKDSVNFTQVDVAANALPYRHVFLKHDLRPVSRKPLELNHKISVWPVFVLFFAFALLVYLRVNSARNFFQVLKSFFSLGYTKQLVRDDYRLNKGTSLALICLFMISLAMFLVKVNIYYGIYYDTISPFLQFLACCFIVFFTYLVKVFANKVLAYIVNQSKQIDEYIFNLFMMNKAIGFFLFPVAVALYYTNIENNYLFVTGIVIATFFYFIRLYRGINIGMTSNGVSVFHLFLYLCVLELLPLIVFIKLLVGRI